MSSSVEIKNICVIGAGVMGSGIAQLVASYGYKVNLVDLDKEILNKSKIAIKNNLEKFYVAKNKISKEESNKILSRITLKDKLLDAIKDVQLILEAVYEDMALKQLLFTRLDYLCDKNIILGSNTSSLSISEIASRTKHQERIIGMHFFNPAPVMKLIELIKGKNTSNGILKKSEEFSKTLNKTVVIVKDSPGFITTRLIYVLCNEAVKLKKEGIASVEDIDIACKLAFNFPMGPLELSDLVGNDIYFHIGQYLGKVLGDEYKPNPLLKKMVEDNLLGKKTKKGFYIY